jgi:hypothetical protein
MAGHHRSLEELPGTRGERLPPEPETAPAEAAPSPILALQHAAGNAAVARLLEQRQPAAAPATGGLSQSITLQAVIPRRPAPASPSADVAPAGRADLDAEEGFETSGEVDPGAVTEAFVAQVGAPAEAQEGATVPLPDKRMPESLEFIDTDTIAGTITYSSTINQAGVVNPFGSTKWSVFNITGQKVTSAPGAFTATFTLENPITFNVTSPKTSIADENDAALTNANYATAASDLTPNMAKQGGKPPRTQFWARDLTVKHERFHSDERQRLNKAGATQAQTWLSAQTAATVAEVEALIAQVPGRVITASQAAVGTVDEKETRAYGDGAPSYKARADAIKAKGDLGTGKGGYP